MAARVGRGAGLSLSALTWLFSLLPDWLMPQWLLPYAVWGTAAIVIMLGMVIIAAWTIWMERRLLGLWQDRHGPSASGPFGLGQVVADMVKIFFKENWTPDLSTSRRSGWRRSWRWR